MTCTQRYHRTGLGLSWVMREWHCCGHVWQLLLSRRWPMRALWAPVCPDCGASLSAPIVRRAG